MAFPGNNYAPPSVYTRTLFENPFNGSVDSLKIPVFIGEGNEYLVRRNLELVRGSSAFIDQRRVNEDMTGRAVVNIAATGAITLGAWDGALTKLQVANLPIVTGAGTGTVSNSRNDVSVTIDGNPIVVLSVDGTTGVVELAQAPLAGAVVKVSYFFNRMDTLITDDVSDQVTATTAFIQASKGTQDVNAQTAGTAVLDIYADVLGPNGEVVVENNNSLNLIVDGVEQSITIPVNATYTMAQLANAIAAVVPGISLTASTFINNLGLSTLQLNADQDITILSGTANAILGLVANSASVRTKTFYTFQGPLVTGDNGGVTTTDPSHVVAMVNGSQIIPSAVDGASRAVTLPVAPPVGATVTLRYYFNSWQDTFDFLENSGVTSIQSVGPVPDNSDFIQGSDYLLKDDKILWGSAWSVEAVEASAGAEQFDDTQISGTLIDNRTYLSPATAIVSSSGGLSSASQRDFLLPYTPTLGNGRDTPLGSSLFQTVSNGRIDLPVNRPDVVTAYWGFGIQDALGRGPVTVLKVEGNVISLGENVPPGADVFATFYYNRLTDETYTLTNTLAGVSGVGTYEVTTLSGANVLGASYSSASKGAALVGTTIVFPSGSELSPDVRFEGVSDTLFTGPVEETVTVQFAAREPTPAKWTSPGAAPYYFIDGQSHRARINIDNAAGSVDPDGAGAGTEALGIDLSDPTSFGAGFFASLVGNEIEYTGEPAGGIGASVVGESYSLLTSEDLVLFIDGVQIDVNVPATAAAGADDASNFVANINLAANGGAGVATGPGAGLNTMDISASGLEHVLDANYFVGWKITIGDTTTSITAGTTATITAHDATGAITVDVNWPGGAAAAADEFRIYNPDTMAQMKSAASFGGSTLITVGQHDTVRFEYVGDTSGGFASGDCVIAAGTYANASDLATAVQAAVNGVNGFDIGTAWAGPGVAFSGAQAEVAADGNGKMVLKFQNAGQDENASFRWLVPTTAVGTYFHVLAGLVAGSPAAATDGALLLNAEVARLAPVNYPTTVRLHDRIVLRNRIRPDGDNTSISGHDMEGQMELRVGAGTGNTKAGFENGMFGQGGHRAAVTPASLLATIGSAGGQDSGGTGFPQLTFYDGTGAKGQNDTLRFVIDGVSVEVVFGSSAAGTAVDIGPVSTAGSVTAQILTALTANGLSASNLSDEAMGFRLLSAVYDSTSQVVIGDGNANGTLNLTEGDISLRTPVTAQKLVSALNGNREDDFTDFRLDFTSVQGAANPMFASQAVALMQKDVAGNEFLFIQSLELGTASVVTVRDPVVGAVVTNSWLFSGTGLNAVDLDGAVGEAGISGFFVTSNKVTGSGSANDSLLNTAGTGVGSDGVVGQTYRDRVTGLSFTILPQNFHDNPTGPWAPYPTGATATFAFVVSKSHTTNANLPVRTIPGFELKVANTLDIGVGDTAAVQTYERGGEEPAVGDVFYATYVYSKESFESAYYTKLSSIEAAYGGISSDNPVTLAAFLAALNGAVLMGIKQVPKAAGSNFAALETYRSAIEDLEGVQPGQINPDIITPLRGDSTDLYVLLKRSNEIQSSIRYKSERTSIIGMSSGNDAKSAQALAGMLSSDRMRLVYPDTAIISLTDAFNQTRQETVDGTMLAAALAGSIVSPNVDVATPWTGRQLVGFAQLGRLLDAVEQNQTAAMGVTVIEEKPPFMRVRHGLTTDMSNILRKTPTVRLISDEVQRLARAVLANFIGVKFMPGILTQVEGRLAMMLKSLVAQQIIAAYTGVKAKTAPDDPTVAEVEAFYQPVFPLLYIVLTFHLRASL